MEQENIKNERESKYEEALQEILDENIDVESQGKDVESLAFSEYDKTNKMLLKYYNERTESDFQKELKAQLNIDVYKKVKDRFDDIDDEINEKVQEEQIRDMSKETLEGEMIDEEIEQKAIKKAQEKANDDAEIDLKAEVMKSIYEEAFDRYSSLLEKYKMNQLRDESMTIGDKEGTELVLYERYLTNLERNYQRYAKYKGLETKTLMDDPDIKAKKEKLEYDIRKMTRANELDIDENLRRRKISADRRNAIAEKMSELSENRKNMSPEQFKQSMDYWRQEYFKETLELRSLDPTLEEYQAQMLIEDENKRYYEKEVGNNPYSKIEVGKYEEDYKDLGNENEEEIYEATKEEVDVAQKSLEDMIEEIERALEQGDVELAEECLEAAETVAFGREVSKRDADENKVKDTDSEVKEGMESKEENDKDLYQGLYHEGYTGQNTSFMEEMSAVANDKEAEMQGRLRDLKEHLNKDRDDMQKEQSKMYEYVRTRNNKKY